MSRILAVTFALSVLGPACTIVNPLFDATVASDGGEESSAGSGGSTAAPGSATMTPTSTSDDSGGETTEPGTSTAAIDSTGPGGSTTGATSLADTGSGDPSSGDATTVDTTGDSTTAGTTGDTSTGGDTGDGLLDVGAHTLVAAAHCVGVDPKQDVIVTLSAAECAALIPQEEITAQQADACPGLDPSQFASLAVDFFDTPSETYVSSYLRFHFPETLAPGTKAVGGVLSLTAGCNAQYGAGKGDNTFKPGDLRIEACDEVPHLDGEKHPNDQPEAFPVQNPQEVGGKVKNALEPGERVEWKVDEGELNALLSAGDDLCIGIWIPFEVNNNIHYQGSDGPAPPRLAFTVQPK